MYGWAAFLAVIVSAGVFLYYGAEDQRAATYLDDSASYIGIDAPRNSGYSGEGVKIAIIDTGIDPTHPDLAGASQDGRLLGRNFVDRAAEPLDYDGHGTQVAGVIAADGSIRGIAPMATIYSYKVTDDGNSVSPNLIIEALKQAIADDVDIINISLGINSTNSRIDSIVTKAIGEGIVVVTAAGNDGPQSGSIGTPGINPNSITVGATYNNVTANLVATLNVNGEQFQVIPMVGTEPLDQLISAPIAVAGYGKKSDFEDADYRGAIVLVERGSDDGSILYFSDKEKNAADAGALAVLVYNNAQGIFLGELLHRFTSPGYEPSIPSLSISREDGLKIRESAGADAALHVFSNPDFVAHFSSRGPVSPFYTKPDLVAPGVFVNSTFLDGGYNHTSGTSFAAPHVSGIAALLLEKNPALTPAEVKSVIVTTADPITDEFGEVFEPGVAGSGRINATTAFASDLIILPTALTFDMTPIRSSDTKTLNVSSQRGAPYDIGISIDDSDAFDISYEAREGGIDVTVQNAQDNFGAYVGRIAVQHGGIQHTIPITVRITPGTVDAADDMGTLSFDIDAPSWSFARIYVTEAATGYRDSTASTPEEGGMMKVYEPGAYWIEARISSGSERYDAYDVIHVTEPAQRGVLESLDLGIPYRSMIILAAITAAVAAVGIVLSRYRTEQPRFS